MISFRSVSATAFHKWIWLGFTTIMLAAFQVYYYVREMVAALLMFSFLVAFVGGTALILFVFDWASQRALAWAGEKCGFEANVLASLQHAKYPPKSGVA